MNLKLHFTIAFVLRLIFLIVGYVQDELLDVKYTDVDYHVFTDAARYVWEGFSPYKRHTYRYTPILAYLLLPNVIISNGCGKVIFCMLDIFTSMLIFSIQNRAGFTAYICKICTFMWLYNPMSIVISTRGNAESIMSFLIMLAIYFHQVRKPFLSGIVYGVSVHFKIYPCIYALSFYFTLSSRNVISHGWKKVESMFYPSRERLIFVCASMCGFLLPTFLSLVLYKDEYLNEALLYHLVRKDIRHNFSPYFYIMYLSESVDARFATTLSFTALLFQALLIALVSWVFTSTQTLPACMFLQTCIFVSFNKVCTSQYFLWYLCLFPLSYPLLKCSSKSLILSFVIWFCGQALWLLPAYYLEFLGENRFMCIFIAGLLFFIVNIYFICLFIKSLNVMNVRHVKNR